MTRTVSTIPPSLRFSSLDTLIGPLVFRLSRPKRIRPGSDGLSACPQGPLDQTRRYPQQKPLDYRTLGAPAGRRPWSAKSRESDHFVNACATPRNQLSGFAGFSHVGPATAEMTTKACASGYSSVMARSIRAEWPGRRDGDEPARRPAGEGHGRPSRRQVDDAEIAEEHPGAKPGSERLGAGLLGGEAFCIGLDPVGAPIRQRALGLGEDALQETIAVPLDGLRDAADVDQICADADDHARCPSLARPRSITARIRRTAASMPPMMASPIRKCPMLSSTISGTPAIASAVR